MDNNRQIGKEIAQRLRGESSTRNFKSWMKSTETSIKCSDESADVKTIKFNIDLIQKMIDKLQDQLKEEKLKLRQNKRK